MECFFKEHVWSAHSDLEIGTFLVNTMLEQDCDMFTSVNQIVVDKYSYQPITKF